MPNNISKSETIQAPAEHVFDLLADPNHLNQVNPDITVTDYKPSRLGGYDMEWEYRFGGITFGGESKIIAFDRPNQLVIDTTGGIPSHWVWTLKTNGEGTHVDLSLDYSVPKQLAFLGKLVEKQNEKSVETQIANLKRLAEES